MSAVLKSRFLKFCLVGGSGVGVNLVVFHLALRGLEPYSTPDAAVFWANGLGILVSIFTNFLLNDQWTWGDREKGSRKRDWVSRLVKYYVSASGGALVQLVVTSVSFSVVFGRVIDTRIFGVDLAATAALLTGIGFGMMINFTASHFWAFRDRESS